MSLTKGERMALKVANKEVHGRVDKERGGVLGVVEGCSSRSKKGQLLILQN